MNSNNALNLFKAITKDYPAPWKLEHHAMNPKTNTQHVSGIVAANGERPIILETFTGDGDVFNLGDEGVVALWEFVNAMHDSSVKSDACSTLEQNYILEAWWVVSILGEISSNMLVNAHKFNTVPPEIMDNKIEQAIARLRQMQVKYREQYKSDVFSIKR